MEYIELTQFLSLSSDEVAGIVRDSGTKVCVFPFNGTRRWFLLEHGHEKYADPNDAYMGKTTQAYIRLYKMLFDHGVEKVIAPIFGKDILGRGVEYMSRIGPSMVWLANHPEFLSFYREYRIRIHFYGDYRSDLLKVPDGAYLIQQFDDATAKTASDSKRGLFYGIFANDATEEIARISTLRSRVDGTVPTRREIVEAYYGEYIEKADLFIGFERFSSYDYPMLNLGTESMYFTVAPSLYMTETLLRKILHDHIFLRSASEPDYATMSPESLNAMRYYYTKKRDEAFGIGVVRDGIWYEGSEIGDWTWDS